MPTSRSPPTRRSWSNGSASAASGRLPTHDNKGAIQTTEKRLAAIMREQGAKSATRQQRLIYDDTDAAPQPAQLSFSVHRVNDYDLQIQHNEAVNLAVEHLGVERLRTDSFFDGIGSRELVKIVPLDHPLTPLDLEAIEDELRDRPQEERDILALALGKEQAADAWLTDYARRRPINKINIDDWRAMVDSVMIDSAYDGQAFDITFADIPERRSDLVGGTYELDMPADSTAVAVRITDMLGEEVLTVLPVAPDA